MCETIRYEKDPNKWHSLRTAAEGHIITAIKQLRRLEGFDYEEILGTFSIHLYNEFKNKEKREKVPSKEK